MLEKPNVYKGLIDPHSYHLIEFSGPFEGQTRPRAEVFARA